MRAGRDHGHTASARLEPRGPSGRDGARSPGAPEGGTELGAAGVPQGRTEPLRRGLCTPSTAGGSVHTPRENGKPAQIGSLRSVLNVPGNNNKESVLACEH